MKDLREPGLGWISLTVLAGACLLAACLDDGDEPIETPPISGVIRNTCGPADGPAIAVRVDRREPQGCAGPMDFKDTANNRAFLYIPDVRLETVAVGQTFTDSQEVCGQDWCAKTGVVYRLEIDKVEGSKVHGTLETRPAAHTGPDVSVRTPVVLAVCPAVSGCG